MIRRDRLIFNQHGIGVGQGIDVGPGKFIKKNKRRPGNKRRVLKFAKTKKVCTYYRNYKCFFFTGAQT